MKVKLSPQVNENKKINYSFDNETITAQCDGLINVYDLSGIADNFYTESEIDGEILIEPYVEETIFCFMPIIKAYRDDAYVLYVELLNFIEKDAIYEEKYPSWFEI